MHKKEGINYSGRLLALMAIALISSVLMLMVTTLAQAEEEAATITVSKTVSGDANPGGTLSYEIVVSASGAGFSAIQLTDTLPISVSYVASSLASSNPAFIVAENNNVITSTEFALNANSQVTVSFSAMITDSAPIGSMITNTVMVEDSSNTLTLTDDASVTVEKRSDPIDLFVDKQVTGGDYLPGGTLEYSIVVSYTGTGFTTFAITDTLPANTTYVPGSLSGTGFVSLAENGGVISSDESPINANTSLEASFMVTINASTPVSTVITNTVMMNDIQNDLLLEDSVGAMVITMTTPTTYYIHLPLLFKAYSPPIMSSIAEPTNNENKWTLTWTDEHSADAKVTGYQIEEATDAGFTQNVAVIEVGRQTSTEVTKPIGSSPVTYYYRVRTMATGIQNGTGAWSGARSVETVFSYEETFSDSSNPNNWRVVREDSDTVINELSVKSDDVGYLDLRMESRFDYMIASNLTQLPLAPYKITARMRLEDADPRHSGGIVLGADYDSSKDCPVDRDGHDFSSCFNKYYRFEFIAGNTPSQMKIVAKRIDSHKDSDNTGNSFELGTVDLEMKSATRASWIEWSIEVSADGEMLIRRDGSEVLKVKDTELQGNRYFGFWSSTADTSFSNTQIDWVKVEQQ